MKPLLLVYPATNGLLSRSRVQLPCIASFLADWQIPVIVATSDSRSVCDDRRNYFYSGNGVVVSAVRAADRACA